MSILAILLIYGAIFAFMVWIYWRIASKAGYPGAYALLMLVPCVNLGVIIYFAFTEWPVEKEVREWREWQRQNQSGSAYPRGPYQPGGYVPPQNPPSNPYDPGQG